MLLYYITDRKQFPGDESQRRALLLKKIADATRSGADYIQLREKDLSGREFEKLARDAVRVIQKNSGSTAISTRLLINSRTDIALTAGAAGVHLPSNYVSPEEARNIWRMSGDSAPQDPTIVVSCHTPDEVKQAQADGADFVVFAPVFEKRALPSALPAGLHALSHACRHEIPVLALGGVTAENARACIAAGAAGIAGIRLFQENEIAEVVQALRR